MLNSKASFINFLTFRWDLWLVTLSMQRIKKFSYKFTNLQQSQIEIEDIIGLEVPVIVYKNIMLQQSRLNNLYGHLMIKISFPLSLASQKQFKTPAQFFNIVKKCLKCASSFYDM